MARCKFCNKEITWMKDGRKNRPIDSDGGIHSCDEMKKTINSAKSLNVTDLDPEILRQYEQSINQKANKK